MAGGMNSVFVRWHNRVSVSTGFSEMCVWVEGGGCVCQCVYVCVCLRLCVRLRLRVCVRACVSCVCLCEVFVCVCLSVKYDREMVRGDRRPVLTM